MRVLYVFDPADADKVNWSFGETIFTAFMFVPQS